ncbi:nucleotide-diphospho-sugar transferase [Tellurirhabdus rosea]|uniref:nucleotide-diphospho-sugar transferase n=1 Tax=Tellurirhabdus rosea TaxID=2674997 RepID=UPI00224DC1C7|nr:nucleotide-diphospho-sugar transferase [Tellurirhabdus rosea]
MNASTFETPILFLMFNRPNHSEKVFNRIKEIKPKYLFIAIDGPRQSNPTDEEKISQCLKLIERIDWHCEVELLKRSTNLGCGAAVSSAITWFFNHVEFGIILEDDCLPDLSFFNYCKELLERYKHNNSVMHIGGVNFQNGIQHGKGSYYFTKICHIWGWATWRRAWKNYDFEMQCFPEFKAQSQIQNVISIKKSQTYWLKAFEDTYQKKIDTWDYQWVYTIWRHSGICILPNVNLVKNIGFDMEATHTKSKSEEYTNVRVDSIQEILHPKFIIENKKATNFSLKKHFVSKNYLERKLERVKVLLQK